MGGCLCARDDGVCTLVAARHPVPGVLRWEMGITQGQALLGMAQPVPFPWETTVPEGHQGGKVPAGTMQGLWDA